MALGKDLGVWALTLKSGRCPRGPFLSSFLLHPCAPKWASQKGTGFCPTRQGEPCSTQPHPAIQVGCLLLFPGTACFDVKSADTLTPCAPPKSVREEGFLALSVEKGQNPSPMFAHSTEHCLAPSPHEAGQIILCGLCPDLLSPQTHPLPKEN